MIAGLPMLSVTDLIIAFQRLERNDWKWEDRLAEGLDGTCDGADPSIVLADVLREQEGKLLPDETEQIRGTFLEKYRPLLTE